MSTATYQKSDIEEGKKLVEGQLKYAYGLGKEKFLELKKYADDGHWSWRAMGLIAGLVLMLNGFLVI